MEASSSSSSSYAGEILHVAMHEVVQNLMHNLKSIAENVEAKRNESSGEKPNARFVSWAVSQFLSNMTKEDHLKKNHALKAVWDKMFDHMNDEIPSVVAAYFSYAASVTELPKGSKLTVMSFEDFVRRVLADLSASSAVRHGEYFTFGFQDRSEFLRQIVRTCVRKHCVTFPVALPKTTSSTTFVEEGGAAKVASPAPFEDRVVVTIEKREEEEKTSKPSSSRMVPTVPSSSSSSRKTELPSASRRTQSSSKKGTVEEAAPSEAFIELDLVPVPAPAPAPSAPNPTTATAVERRADRSSRISGLSMSSRKYEEEMRDRLSRLDEEDSSSSRSSYKRRRSYDEEDGDEESLFDASSESDDESEGDDGKRERLLRAISGD